MCTSGMSRPGSTLWLQLGLRQLGLGLRQLGALGALALGCIERFRGVVFQL